MTYNLEELKELVPLYLNRHLSETERKAFEEGLHQYPELRQALEECAEIKEVYQEIEREIPLPSDTLFERVLRNIQPQQEKFYLPPWKKWDRGQIWGFLKWVFSSPRVSWGIVAVQFAIILFLIIFLPQENHFRTLTSSQSHLEGVKINVIFDQGSKEKEIMDLLIQVGAIIIRGPSPEGLYIIEIERNQDIKRVLDHLKQAPIVKFAEIAY